MGEAIHPADLAAFEQAVRARPAWDAIETAADAFNLDRRVLLHAGPAFESTARISAPILNSACVAAVYEGIAADFDAAEAKIRAGDIELRPAQDHATVTPLAAVVSASMPMHRVVDLSKPEIRVYSPINGGGRPAMRLGLRSEAVLEHIRWLNGSFSELLESALSSPIELLPIAAEGLRGGDDCHGRTPLGSEILMRRVADALAGGIRDADTRQFIDASPSLFLNPWMAASKCIMRRAQGVASSSFVTAAGGNGVDVAIQVSAMPGRWFSTPASPPLGRFDVDLPASRALPAIGDSAVVECLGLGAMAIGHSPEQVKNLGDFLPADHARRGAELLAGVHPAFGELQCRVGLLARAASAFGHGPVIGLGILDVEGEKGRLGGGIYDMPAAPFSAAVSAIER